MSLSVMGPSAAMSPGPPDIPTYVPFPCDRNGPKNLCTFDFCADIWSKTVGDARFSCTNMGPAWGDVLFLCGQKPAGWRSSLRSEGLDET